MPSLSAIIAHISGLLAISKGEWVGPLLLLLDHADRALVDPARQLLLVRALWVVVRLLRGDAPVETLEDVMVRLEKDVEDA